MVFSPGAGRGPLPKPVAVLFVVLGGVFLFFSVTAITKEPEPRFISCTRESAETVACGTARGRQASTRRQTGKNAKDCLTLDQSWVVCGGNVTAAAAKINALAVGAKTDVDVTPAKQTGSFVVGILFAIVMIGGGIGRLLQKGR